MVDGAIHKASKAEFLDVFRLCVTNPYVLLLAISAGIGGFLFGYDTGVISGASLYIQDEFPEVAKSAQLQGLIVSLTPGGAILGAALGGWMNDKHGRRVSILVADFVFFIGAIVMGAAPTSNVIILGRFIVGVGVGMASMTAPLYISEASPTKVRGALVSFNGLLITGGQFIAYLTNLAFTKVPHSWRWMLGVAGIPALVQFVLMFWLPESPRWLYRKGRKEESINILRKIYTAEEVEQEIVALKTSVEDEIALAGGGAVNNGIGARLKDAFSSPIFRRGLIAGVGVQVIQQFVGINTVMYYSPTIIQFAGIVSNSTAIALSLITSGLNAIGSIVSMGFVDKYGRKKLMIISLVGIILCLGGLATVFKVSDLQAPKVDGFETARFGNNTCPVYLKSPNSAWTCRSCLDASTDCAFCSNSGNQYQPGACVAMDSTSKGACHSRGQSQFYTKGCPSKTGPLAILFLGLYIISYSPGMGTAPWIVNSEIYQLKHRGIGGGMAAMANWISNLIVSDTFLLFIKAFGSSFTFLIFAGFSFLGLLFIIWFVPETKGLSLEEVEQMLEGKSSEPPSKK